MNNRKIYLAGAMKGLTWEDANQWRIEVTASLPNHIETLSPIRGKLINRGGQDVIENSYENDPITSSVGINVRDYNDVKTCDLVIANLNGMNAKSVGTIMEIAWTRAFDIPCIIVLDGKENAWHDHPMLRFGNIICQDLGEAINVAVSLLSTDRELEHLGKL